MASGGAPTVSLGGTSAKPPGSGGRGGATGSQPEGGSTAVPEAGNGPTGGTGVGEGGAPAEPPPPTFTKALLLEAVASCTLTELRDFVTLARTLRQRTSEYAAEPSDAKREAAREAYLAAMDALQVLEVFRFGPAARMSEEPAGRDLRDQIYAWPLGGRCNIETQLVSEAYASASFATSLINGRGFGALEYLLFYGASDNACPDYSPLNSQGQWAALGEAGLRERKARYADAVASSVLSHAEALLAAWESGNYAVELTSAGTGESKTYASAQAALNAISNGMFYVEVEVKDLKLGVPLGLSPDCLATSCPEALESRYAQISSRNISQNLLGFSRLFQGCGKSGVTSLGFDDWLRSVAADDLAMRMQSALDGAKQAVAELPEPLESLLPKDPARVRAVYDRLKVLTDLLKSEFVTVLELELPKSTEGDND